jgi:hypothetical protein
MNGLDQILIGLVIGIASSLFAWWVLNRLLAPRIRWSGSICKDQWLGTSRYRIKFANLGIRDVVDAEVRCTVRIVNLDNVAAGKAGATNTATVSLPLHGGTADVLRKTWWGAKLKGRARLAQIDTSGISTFQLPRMASEVRDRIARGEQPALEQILGQGKHAYVDFTFYGYDVVSGARRVRRSKHYTRSDIIPGRFEKGSLRIVPSKSTSRHGDH